MMGSERGKTSRMIAPILAVLLCTCGIARGQQAAKRMVPDNPSPHPAPEQPLPYSHKQHLAFSLQCKDCHTNPDPGTLMTFPPTSKCMQCHVTIAKDKPAIQKLADVRKFERTHSVGASLQGSPRRRLEPPPPSRGRGKM